MGFLKHLPAGIFVSVAVAVCAFTVAVLTNHKALQMYEGHVKKPLQSLEFLFILIGLLYFVLPMISFTVVSDWTKTFFDCFSPMTLWMDVVYSGVIMINFIIFLGDMKENFGRILTEYEGMGVLLSCIYGYVMLKSSNDANYSRVEANVQNMLALLFLVGFGLATLLQLQFRFVVPVGYSKIAWCLAALGGTSSQALQPALSIYFRIIGKGNFNNDDPSTKNVKVSAASVRVIALTYDVWLCSSKGYWKSSDKTPFATMICGCLIVSWLQLVYRYLGPRNVKNIFDMLWDKEALEKVRQRAMSASAGVHVKTLNFRVLERV